MLQVGFWTHSNSCSWRTCPAQNPSWPHPNSVFSPTSSSSSFRSPTLTSPFGWQCGSVYSPHLLLLGLFLCTLLGCWLYPGLMWNRTYPILTFSPAIISWDYLVSTDLWSVLMVDLPVTLFRIAKESVTMQAQTLLVWKWTECGCNSTKEFHAYFCSRSFAIYELIYYDFIIRWRFL